MSTLESKSLCTPCFFRADGVECTDGYLYYTQPTLKFRCYDCKREFNQDREPGEHAVCPTCQSQDIVQNRPRVFVEGEPVSCSACEGRGRILTSDGRQLLMFMQTFGRSVLRDLVDEAIDEKGV